MQKDAKKQAVTLLFEEKYTLEDIGVNDKQALIITEVLTDQAKQIIEQHYAKEKELQMMDEAFGINEKDSSLLRSSVDYSSSNPRFSK